MEFIIDNRESIKKYFLENHPKTSKCINMDIGDFQINFNDEPIVIFERKTIEDLAASITDGRYREQKKRLLNNYSKKQIIYIIEGDLTKDNKSIKFNKISKDTIYSTIINIYLRDNINIINTKNINETIEYLEQFCNKIEKQGINFLLKPNSEYKDDLVKTIVPKKKSNMTPESVFISQLNCISGISLKSSQIIVTKYINMNNLILELNKLTQEERIKNISELTYISDKEKQRKLGTKFAEKLVMGIGVGFN